MKPKDLCIIILLVSIFISSCSVSEVKLFPSVKGIVNLYGVPVNQAKVVQNVKSPILNIKHETFTDKNGMFILPNVSESILHGPHGKVTTHLIEIYYKGDIYIGLNGDRDYRKDYYTDSYTVELLCDLKNNVQNYKISTLNGNWYREDDIAYRESGDLEEKNREYKTVYEYSGICSPIQEIN